jgi:2-oxoglutarate dehydrogenase E2 component (dihydrolipoamide succinyltransferase)
LQIPKVSRGARLTIEDVSAFLASQDQTSPQKERKESKADVDDPFAGRKIPHTPMRKSIASHMARSVQTAPHVTSVFEADLSAVLSDRARRKADKGDEAVPSVTAYLIQAALIAIRVVPEVNSKWHDDYLEVFDWVNFGVGTALESGGLVVPVIRGAQAMDLLTLSQRLREMTQKARGGKLTQDDMSGGTFTLSNHGVSGSLLAAPIILPHGQAAILGAGKMQRRVIVCETGGRELFRIRPMMYVTLTIDHRVLDGQQTNLFLTKFVAALEASNDADAEA